MGCKMSDSIFTALTAAGAMALVPLIDFAIRKMHEKLRSYPNSRICRLLLKEL